MKDWFKRAVHLLEKSLHPVPCELNELDWKLSFKDDTKKITQHLSALANNDGGGFLVFGIERTGELVGVAEDEIEKIVLRVGNIARDGLDPATIVDHEVHVMEGKNLLVIAIIPPADRPVHIRGKSLEESYIRSGGQTRKTTKHEIGKLMSEKIYPSFEEAIAIRDLQDDDVIRLLDVVGYFDLSGQSLPESKQAILDKFESENFIKRHGDKYAITNLGALLFAKNLDDFRSLSRKALRVIAYASTGREEGKREIVEKKGYASGFQDYIKDIQTLIPTNEVIEQAIRREVKMYPEIALRELVANALIHQDFFQEGVGPTVEVFKDRVEITNPGAPLVQTLRFIDFPPRSRNEALAAIMRRLNLCEERGSGIDKVISSVEVFQLPAPSFMAEEGYLKAVLYAHRELKDMNQDDRIRACYQHTCLKYVSNERMSNATLRARFNITQSNYPMASKIISDTIEARLIKPQDPTSKSKKFALYVPFWTS